MIVPPATIGLLGGGQLGRYLLVAARQMGYGTVVVDPDPLAPAGRAADEHLVAAYDAAAALDHLARRCAVVTTEFENPPASALQRLAADVVVAPSAAAVAIAQDRLAEKRFLEDHAIPVAPFTPILDADAPLDLAYPVILKTARLGYDGRGQRTAEDGRQLVAAWRELGGVACVAEQRLPLDAELSVVVARRADGATAVYPVAENHHVDGVLDLTVVPARIDDALATEATHLALAIVGHLDYVGVLTVELFVSEGRLVVNELAPRPHNSGHWTLDAAVTSQFEQQVRAVCGLALGVTHRTAAAVAMVNLLGERWSHGEPDWTGVLGQRDVRLHLYGKAAARPGRKMGHLTVLGEDPTSVAERAGALRERTVR